MLAFLDQVAGETYKIGSERVDLFNDGGQITMVALVMDVADLDNAMRDSASGQTDPADFHPFWLKPRGIPSCNKGCGHQTRKDKPPPSHHSHVHLTSLHGTPFRQTQPDDARAVRCTR